MGVLGFWAWMRKKGVQPHLHQVTQQFPASLHLPSLQSKIRVDFLGSFFPAVLWAYSNHTRDKAHLILESLLKKLGNQQRLIIYFDGDPAEEKADTHRHRQDLRDKAQIRACNALEVLRGRVDNDLTVRKSHFNNVRKHLRGCFKWIHADRDVFIALLRSKGWVVVLCETEADVKIAQDCLIDDVVVSRDSDMLIHMTISTLWKPIRRATQGKFLVYEVPSILARVGLTRTQLTAVGVVTKNDYTSNIRTLGIAINHDLLRCLDGQQDVPTLILQYLALDKVILKNKTGQTFSTSINVFVNRRQTPITTDPPANAVAYDNLRSEFNRVCNVFEQRKRERQAARRDSKRAPVSVSQAPVPAFHVSSASGASVSAPACTKKPQHRSRYSFKKRRKGKEHDSPEVITSFVLKSYKKPPDLPVVTTPTKTSKTTSIRRAITSNQKKAVLNALTSEHPIVSLDIGTIRTNVHGVHGTNAALTREVVECIQGAAREALIVKRQCQQYVGMYLQRLLSGNTIDDDDPTTDATPATNSGSDEREGDDDQNNQEDDDARPSDQQVFLKSVMTCLYSKNRPRGDIAASRIITRLEELHILPPGTIHSCGHPRQSSKYTPADLVRSVASQMAAELTRHFLKGSRELYIKLKKDMNNGLLPSGTAIELRTEISYDELRERLKDIMAPAYPNEPREKFNKTWCVSNWMPGVDPGLLIKAFICNIAPKDDPTVTACQKRKSGHLAAIELCSLDRLKDHVNMLRQRTFDPQQYDAKGYFLRGSIRTNGHRLQLIAYKLRELQSVCFRRYKTNVLPNRLLSTVGGTNDYLTEVRNVFSCSQDVEDLLGCSAKDVRKEVRVLGLDLGQAFVVGASAVQGMPPKRRRRKRGKGRKSRRRRGKKRGHGSNTALPDYYNLAVSQKAVYQPTLKFRRWLEAKKASTITGTEQTGSVLQTICDIESNYPPLRGPAANIEGYFNHRSEYAEVLDKFYNGTRVYKQYSWDAKKARKEEYRRAADNLLRMIGGSLGAPKDKDEKVVIGVGLSKFSTGIRLSSLDGTFGSYFIQTARALGYIVVGVNEYFTSKKCPSCKNFVAQVGDNIRCFYCTSCKKYMHRDIMAGQNICNVVLGHLIDQQRPLYLQPQDAEGNYPWMQPQAPQEPADRLKRAGMDVEGGPSEVKKRSIGI
ncbi:hypothetical protein BGZ98_006802 [Dissophora globulifera]|nr:hypothetical protein BGZ98_006802 [Dissophora globulifera]